MSMRLDLNNDKAIPPGVKGWNWGAFFWTWIWGICNGTYIALLSLIPGVHFVMMFVLGAKGNEWAWCNKNWESVEQFHRTQRKWVVWGIGLWLLMLGLLAAFLISIWGYGVETEMPEIKAMIGDFDPHRKYCNYALESAERDPRCSSYFGSNLALRGNAEAVRDSRGNTEIALPVRGDRGQGTIYLRTHKNESSAELTLEEAEVELKDMSRMKLDTKASQERLRAAEERVVKLVAAARATKVWNQREPNSREEAQEFFQEAVQRLKADPRVVKEFGHNITTQVEGANVNLEGSMGDANFRVMLRGEGRSGSLNIKGFRSMGRWTFDGAQLQLPTGVLDFPAG